MALRSIEDIRRSREKELLDKPNVVGVGIGKKDDKDVITVLVTHKVPQSELRPEDVVPKTVDGYETVVQEIGVVTTEGR
jgi:hypothetical protein